MNDVFLLIGGNIGDRLAYLRKASDLIDKNTGSIVAKSSVYETAAWGLTDQAPFLNQVLKIETALSPERLLATILQNEEVLGRKRAEKMGPRIIDIDILFYTNLIISRPDLNIPHPEIQNRKFALTPMAQLASDFIHPVLNKTIWQLLIECPDALEVKLYENN